MLSNTHESAHVRGRPDTSVPTPRCVQYGQGEAAVKLPSVAAPVSWLPKGPCCAPARHLIIMKVLEVHTSSSDWNAFNC